MAFTVSRKVHWDKIAKDSFYTAKLQNVYIVLWRIEAAFVISALAAVIKRNVSLRFTFIWVLSRYCFIFSIIVHWNRKEAKLPMQPFAVLTVIPDHDWNIFKSETLVLYILYRFVTKVQFRAFVKFMVIYGLRQHKSIFLIQTIWYQWMVWTERTFKHSLIKFAAYNCFINKHLNRDLSQCCV